MFHCIFDRASHGSTYFQVLLSADMYFCMSFTETTPLYFQPVAVIYLRRQRQTVRPDEQCRWVILFEIGGVMEEGLRKETSVTCYSSLKVILRRLSLNLTLNNLTLMWNKRTRPNKNAYLKFVKVTTSSVTSIIFKRLQTNPVNSRLFLSRDTDGPVQYAPGYRRLE